MNLDFTGENKQKILIFAGVAFLFVIFIVFAIVSQIARNSDQAGTEVPTDTTDTTGQQGNNLFMNPTGGQRQRISPPVPGAVAKVGEELIYNSDITREVSALPNSDDPTVMRNSFRKIVIDSITLQSAAAEGYITLDATVFNSTTKDYPKRIALVDQAKREIAKNGDSYSGTIVSLWFYNQVPPAIGYAQGKQKAFNTIKPIYDKVKAGEMTMLQASDAIIADETLYDVDEAYKVNSYGEFVATPENPPTFDSGFNTQLARLRPGQVSDLYVAKSEDVNGNVIDAVYIFGKVDKIISGKGYTDYEGWLELQTPKYEVIEY